MPEPSSLFYIAAAAATALSGANYAPDAGQPGWFGKRVQLEKVYAQGGKVVGTPTMNVAEALEKCPDGYVVRREGRVEREGQTVLTWTLNCQ